MTDRPDRAILFCRADGKFDWHLLTPEGEVLYGSLQGYEHKSDARESFERHHPDVELEDRTEAGP